MNYTTGETSVVEDTIERPDNAWCRRFFRDESEVTPVPPVSSPDRRKIMTDEETNEVNNYGVKG